MTFLALDFWCTPPPNHSGDISVNRKFATNPVGTRGLPLGEDRCWPTCRPFKVFTSERRQESLGPSNSSYVCYGIIYRNRPTQKWSNTITAHWWQHRRVVVLSFFLLFLMHGRRQCLNVNESATYFGSLRSKLILSPLAMPKGVWPLMNWY